MFRCKILFLAASPLDCTSLELDEEARAIQQKILQADQRDALEFVPKFAVRRDDLQLYLNKDKPHVLHFSGHGSIRDEIEFKGDDGNAAPVSKAGLKAMLKAVKDNIRLVVLNACYTQRAANSITDVIDCAIGMKRGIGDEAARVFAASFYLAIGFGRSVKNAFDQAIASLQVIGIPEDNTPVLSWHNGIDPDKVFLVAQQGTQTISEPGIQKNERILRNKIFISYSHKDKKFLDELLTHLKPMLRAGSVNAWSDKQLVPTSKWFDEIKSALVQSSIVVMLVTPAFLASDFIHEHELGPMLKEAEAGDVKILWILIRDCAYRETPLQRFQAVVSPPGKPFAQMKADRDTAWRQVCEAIKGTAISLVDSPNLHRCTPVSQTIPAPSAVQAEVSSDTSNTFCIGKANLSRPVHIYREFVKREWLSRWADSAADQTTDNRPRFIEDQIIRILESPREDAGPRPFLRVEYFRRLRAESSRRRMVGGHRGRDTQRYSDLQRTATSEREVWIPISREEIILHLASKISPSRLHRSVVATDAGVGKTTTIRWMHYLLNSGNSTQLALFVDVADLPTNPNDFLSVTLVSALRLAKGNDALNLTQEVAEALLHELKSQGRLVLLFDALDQIHAAERTCLHTLKRILADENWNTCHIVLGSRPFALERDWSLLFGDEHARGWRFLHVEEFTEEQQRRYLGEVRYATIPRDAYDILSIPRVLYYLSLSRNDDHNAIRTVSDVYWFATSKLLAEGVRATDARDTHPAHARLVLGAIAFEMVASGNFDEVQPSQMDKFILAVSRRCKTFSDECTADWTYAKVKQIAAMNEFLRYGILEAGCPQRIQWRNRSLQEFFAGLWISKYCADDEVALLSNRIFLPKDPWTGDFYWMWRFATEMPDDGRDADVWVKSMRCLFRASDCRASSCKRSSEMVYRSWCVMSRLAKGEGNTAFSRQVAKDALETFSAEFPAIVQGQFGPAAKRVAKQLLGEFRPIPGEGAKPASLSFRMGSPVGENGRGNNEPLIEAHILTPFELTCFLITQEQYALFDPGHIPWQKRRRSKRRRPVVGVSWFDAWVFCKWMGEGFRLPTEKEWEFACRAGTSTAFSFGDRGSRAYMRCNINNPRVLIPVGCLRPNPWGLFDMHGLSWEWCDTWYADSPNSAFCSDFAGEYRVARGGAANTSVHRARSSERNYRDPADSTGLISFRVVRTG